MSYQVPPPGGYPPYGAQGQGPGYGPAPQYPPNTQDAPGPYPPPPYQGAPYQGAPYQGGPYTGAPYPGGPKSGSGTKIVVAVAAVVVVIGIVVGGVALVVRSGSNNADPPASTSANPNKGGGTIAPQSSTPPSLPATTAPPSTKPLGDKEAEELAQAAFPLVAGSTLRYCFDTRASDADAVYGLSCSTDAGEHYVVFVWSDTDAATAALRGSSYPRYQERRWVGGLEFYYDASPIYYETFRCYSQAPVCIRVFEDTKELGDAILGKVIYLDAAGLADLNARLAGR